MARLHEYHGKTILNAKGISVPDGELARSPEAARGIAERLGGPVVVKAQAWTTGRAGMGAIKFANDADEAAERAGRILGMKVKGFEVEAVLVEERLQIAREFYAGFIIDDIEQMPVMIFSRVGGTGIEEIAREEPEAVARVGVDVRTGLAEYQARDLIRGTGIHGKLQRRLAGVVAKLYALAREYDARAAEINPLVITEQGEIVAVDCRVTVDDYGVYRHPDLGIEIAREFDRPPTELEKIAWGVEKGDYRGTFYFIQLEHELARGPGVIGFHGAGGGGSMMSMDAVLNKGYRLANFVDTSGNPPASKVYRAAKIILSQPGIDGYFASGSGVASQEQFHSARGLVKAFMEEPLCIPAVIRLGGNAEARAIRIIERAQAEIPAPVEAYGKDDPPDFCAGRLDTLIRGYTRPEGATPGMQREPLGDPYSFETVTEGQVSLDHARCRDCESKICVDTCVPGILSLNGELPVLNISREEARKGGCIECLACEVECYFEGNKGGYIHLPIPGLDAYREAHGLGRGE